MAAAIPADGEIRYLVLADRAVPYLLARVRWPDVAQAISAASPDWLEDPGLFDLPYDPSAVTVSFSQAASVAAGWGTQLHAEVAEGVPSYLRRMPANWSDLTPSERRTWGIEFVGRGRAPAHRVRRQRPLRAKAAAPAAPQANGHVATEQRRDTRVRVDGRAHIRSGHTTISAGLVDLGEGGVQCVLPEDPHLVSPGATLGGPFLFEAETMTSRICLDVMGRISWRRSAGADTHFGVAFGELADGETDGLRRFLAAANGKGRR
jgi:hypothetical protein